MSKYSLPDPPPIGPDDKFEDVTIYARITRPNGQIFDKVATVRLRMRTGREHRGFFLAAPFSDLIGEVLEEYRSSRDNY